MKRTLDLVKTDRVQECPVFLELFKSNLPANEKLPSRINDEVFTLTLGGASAVVIGLTSILHNLLTHERVAQKLRQELIQNVPDAYNNIKWATLENLPYLTAVIQEGIRLMHDPQFQTLPYETGQERSPPHCTRRRTALHA